MGKATKPAKMPTKKGAKPRPGFPVGVPHEEIGFGVAQSSSGSVLVAASKKGVVAILIGKDSRRLIQDLQQRFPRGSRPRWPRPPEAGDARGRLYRSAERRSRRAARRPRDGISAAGVASGARYPRRQDIDLHRNRPQHWGAESGASGRQRLLKQHPGLCRSLSSGVAQGWLAFPLGSLQQRPSGALIRREVSRES